MIRFLFILTTFVWGLSAQAFAQEDVPFDASTLGADGDVIAFVGKEIFVRRNDPPGPSITEETIKATGDETEDTIIISMRSARYEVRFEIIDLLAGNYEAETIDFETYYHVGKPSFSESENAFLIFVYDGPDNYTYSKYNAYEVNRTADGDWAACGNPYTQYDPDEIEKEPLEAISFLESVTMTVPSLISTMNDFFDENDIISDADRAEAQSEIDEEYKEADGILRLPIWKRDGNTATCLMGTRVEDLFKFQNETRFLPDKRDGICRERYNEELDAFGNDYKAKRTLIDDCTALLKIQNLP